MLQQTCPKIWRVSVVLVLLVLLQNGCALNTLRGLGARMAGANSLICTSSGFPVSCLSHMPSEPRASGFPRASEHGRAADRATGSLALGRLLELPALRLVCRGWGHLGREGGVPEGWAGWVLGVVTASQAGWRLGGCFLILVSVGQSGERNVMN